MYYIFLIHPQWGSVGTEKSTVWWQINYLVKLLSTQCGKKTNLSNGSPLLAAAAATASNMGVLHSESLRSILHVLISVHEISCSPERGVGSAQETHWHHFSSFQEAEEKVVDVKWAQLAIWVLTEETVLNHTQQGFFVLMLAHPDGFYCSETLCLTITNPWITVVSATSNIWWPKKLGAKTQPG